MNPDPLPSDIADALRSASESTAPFGRAVHYFHETGSTNDIAIGLAERGAPEGTVVVSSSQTAGRGRLGREWFSPPDAGLYVSVICRNSAAAPFLTLAGGIGVADGVRAATGLPVEIKWPNDIMAPPGTATLSRRKLAGILAEASSTGAEVQYVVLGFGINLRPAAYPPEIASRATSLEVELGRVVDPGPLLAAILVEFARRYAQLAAASGKEVLDRWRALAPSAYGSRVEWEEGRHKGVTEGIAEDGALLIRTEKGVERVIAGTLAYR